nr:heavy metal translocating P-type ATPase [Pseudomonas sp. CFSAN084952]
MEMEAMGHEAGEYLGFRIEGMDCASCVSKIETALGRIKGLSDVKVNFASETLTLRRDSQSRATEADIAKKIRSLGFDVQAMPASCVSAVPEPRQVTHLVDRADCGSHHDHVHDHPHVHAKACSDHRGHDHGHKYDHGHSHEHGPCSGHDRAPASPARRTPSTPPNVSMRVEGMDCASCVGKIETALARMAGVSEARINFTAETLELTLASGGPTQLGHIEKTVKELGFGVSDVRLNDGSALAAPTTASKARRRWWQTKKGKYLLGLGGLMGSAYAIAWFIPGYAQWIYAAAVIVGVLPFARRALALAMSGSPFSIETLMVVASLGALVIGEAEEAAAVVFLFAVGELLESVAAGRSRAGIKALASLMPKTAVLLDSTGGQREVPAASLRVSDRVLVRPGDRVPADGKILRGESSLDESPITGESVPRQKGVGADVFAGAINVDGAFEVQVEKTATDNTISRIIQLVEQAQSSKAPTARLIEKFSRYYTPAVMSIAALVVAVPTLAMGGNWETWLYRSLALLLIACPCALLLSTPAAIASGLAVATRRGLLIKGGSALETISRVRAIAFDKTGTLTEGKPRITEVVPFGQFEYQKVLALAAAVESGSNHPLAKAIVAHAKSLDVPIPQATDASAIAGKAVRATVDGNSLVVGSPVHAGLAAMLKAEHRQEIDMLEEGGNTVVVLFDEASKNVLGLLALRDEPRRDAREGVSQLNAMGVRAVMLTGDNRWTAQAIASKLGIEWEAELLPQDKLRLVNTMKHDAKVAMVGDGINDAPALAIADVGIAMGGARMWR